MTPQPPWLLLDVGNTAIKWRLTQADCLLTPGGAVTDVEPLAGKRLFRTPSYEPEFVNGLFLQCCLAPHLCAPRSSATRADRVAVTADPRYSVHGVCTLRPQGPAHVLAGRQPGRLVVPPDG